MGLTSITKKSCLTHKAKTNCVLYRRVYLKPIRQAKEMEKGIPEKWKQKQQE